MAKSNGKRVRKFWWIAGLLAMALAGAQLFKPKATVVDEKNRVKTAKAELGDVQVRVTVEATGGDPVPMVDSLSYIVSAPLLNDYINDVDVSALAGAYRIGVGDVRVPMPNPYSTLLELQVVIQDARAGTWSWQVVDKALTYGPRVQFKLNGVLTDPDLADFITKGF